MCSFFFFLLGAFICCFNLLSGWVSFAVDSLSSLLREAFVSLGRLPLLVLTQEHYWYHCLCFEFAA